MLSSLLGCRISATISEKGTEEAIKTGQMENAVLGTVTSGRNSPRLQREIIIIVGAII